MVQSKPLALALPPSKPGASRVRGAAGPSGSGEGAAAVRPGGCGLRASGCRLQAGLRASGCGLPSLDWICRLPGFLPASCGWLLPLPAKRKRTLLRGEEGLIFSPGGSKPAQKALSRDTWRSQWRRRQQARFLTISPAPLLLHARLGGMVALLLTLLDTPVKFY